MSTFFSRPRIQPIPPGPGQESVWDYPRPPRLEETRRRIQVRQRGVTLVDAPGAWRVLETSHPPVYYIDPRWIAMEHFNPGDGSSLCEWKGQARYFDLVVGDERVPRVAWTYGNPTDAFAPIRDHLAIYPSRVSACFVGGERVRAQAGDFYGGWITGDIVGPFKGEPGTMGW